MDQFGNKRMLRLYNVLLLDEDDLRKLDSILNNTIRRNQLEEIQRLDEVYSGKMKLYEFYSELRSKTREITNKDWD